MTLPDLQSRRDDLLRLAAKYGATNLRVFGSVARGDTTPFSDVDFLVNFPADRSIFDLVGLWIELQELLGCEVDLSTEENLKDYVRATALKDAVPL